MVFEIGGNISLHKIGGLILYSKVSDSPRSFASVKEWTQPKPDIVGAGRGACAPDEYWDGTWSSPALGDIDSHGDLEIAVEGFVRRLPAWHHDGTTVAG